MIFYLFTYTSIEHNFHSGAPECIPVFFLVGFVFLNLFFSALFCLPLLSFLSFSLGNCIWVRFVFPNLFLCAAFCRTLFVCQPLSLDNIIVWPSIDPPVCIYYKYSCYVIIILLFFSVPMYLAVWEYRYSILRVSDYSILVSSNCSEYEGYQLILVLFSMQIYCLRNCRTKIIVLKIFVYCVC